MSHIDNLISGNGHSRHDRALTPFWSGQKTAENAIQFDPELDVSSFWEKNRKSNQITLAWRSVIGTANVISHFLSIQWVYQHRTTVQCSNEKVFVLTDFTEYIYYHLRVQMVFFSPTWLCDIEKPLGEGCFFSSRYAALWALLPRFGTDICRYTKRI